MKVCRGDVIEVSGRPVTVHGRNWWGPRDEDAPGRTLTTGANRRLWSVLDEGGH